jgi:hypothetical protein
MREPKQVAQESARFTVAVLSRRSMAVSPLPMVRTPESRAALYSLIRLAVISASSVTFPKKVER